MRICRCQAKVWALSFLAKADQVRRDHAAARRQPLGGHVPPQVAPGGRAVQAQPGDGRVARAFVHVAQAQAAQGGQAAFGMARPGVIGQMGKARGRRAQRVLPQRGGVDAARPEKAVQRSGAFARQHAASDLRLMVERGLGKQVEQRTGRARFGVGRAKNHARQPRVQHGPGAHGARLQRHIQRAALQPVIAQRPRGLAQGGDFGMRAGVMRAHAGIASGGDAAPVLDHHRAHRHFAARCRFMRGLQGQAHPAGVFRRFGRGSFWELVHDLAGRGKRADRDGPRNASRRRAFAASLAGCSRPFPLGEALPCAASETRANPSGPKCRSAQYPLGPHAMD